MKKVLMACSLPYTSPLQVGSHHYARVFKKLGYDVYFLGVPVSPLHKLSSDCTVTERIRVSKTKGEIKEGVWHYVPNTYLPPKNIFPLSTLWAHQNWHHFTAPKLSKILKNLELGEVDILWFDSALHHFLLNWIPHKTSIFRVADDGSAFKGLSKQYQALETQLAQKVDHVITSSKNMQNHFTSHNGDCHYVPNGVDLKKLRTFNTALPPEYANIASPRVVYIGAIHEWFDMELVIKAAKTYPQKNFVLIGPCRQKIKNIKMPSNIHFLGTVPYHRIGEFLSHADLGIIPFKQTKLVQSIHPLKVYEYAAFGLPALSIAWEELKNMPALCQLVNTHSEFIKALDDPIKQATNTTKVLESVSWENRLCNFLKNIDVTITNR
ncbi:glycosyltransferase [bacterium]|jgi:glycosyltransferase involved in cell wall biosynthesis|nr:glycosyltransferase [bacterium]